jgi:transcriptional repressor of cell division inhibition gene dicB
MKIKTKDAIAYFGSASKLANALGINRASVSGWGQHVPSLRAYQLHVLTKGALGDSKEGKKTRE